MDHYLFLFRDDEFADPIYAEPDPDDIEDELWTAACEAVQDAFTGDGKASGVITEGEHYIGWKLHSGTGVSVVVVVEAGDLTKKVVESHLSAVLRRYLDEVDDARFPEVNGVADVVVDVIPPWDE